MNLIYINIAIEFPKKLIFNLQIKIISALLLLLNLTGCSLDYGRKNYLTEKRNNINLEIIKNFSKAISRDPNNSTFYLERGIAKNEYGHFKGAIKDYEKLNFFGKYRDQIFYNLASAQLTNFDYQNAINNFTKSIGYDDKDEFAYLYRGNSKFKLEDYQGSSIDYGKSLEINDRSYIAFNNRGVSNFKLKNYRSALEDFKKSLKINPRNYNTLYNKSLTHFELKEIKKACINLKKSIKLGKEVFKDEYFKICL